MSPNPPSPRRLLRPLSVGLGLALAATPLSFVTAPAQAAPVTLTVVDFNDFHGRLDGNTAKWATTIEKIRAEAGDENTVLVAGGDNIGASLFASSLSEDEGTVEVLNALELDSSAMGNHEFDRGFDWYRSRPLTGTGNGPDGEPYTKAAYSSLGANVIDTSTGEPALPASRTPTVQGASVCTVGAVTEETPSLVSPQGVEGLRFDDPVASVNREVARLKTAGTECDVTIATYHEGAPKSDPATLEQQKADSPVFAKIVDQTDPSVDVIINGHTHQGYAYTAPIPGQEGKTRPVVSAKSYGEAVGRVDLTVDPATDEVTAAAPSLVPRAAAADLSMPRVAEVDRITRDAMAKATEVGAAPVGKITDDVTRALSGGSYTGTNQAGQQQAYTGGTGEDRASESTLGNLVADALKQTAIPAMGERRADLGLVNPGGIRADLTYAGATEANPENTDGVVTYAEADAVLPFVNNISYVSLTGAQIKKVLEQQWQPATASRPFLAMGVSKNVRTTVDPKKPAGERVTSIRIDGKPIADDRTYTVSTFSFLAQGGDNFTAFTQGKAVDTGAVDRDLWIDSFWKSQGTQSPDYARRQSWTDAPTRLFAGQSAAFTVDKLDLTSLGTPRNTAVIAELVRPTGEVAALGSFPATDGSAAVQVKIPAGAPAGATLRMRSDVTGARIEIPVRGSRLKLTDTTGGPILAGRTRPSIRATLETESGEQVAGTLTVRQGGRTLATRETTSAQTDVRLPAFAAAGTPTLSATFVPTGGGDASTASLTLRVRKSTPTLTTRVRPDTIRVGRTRTRVVVKVAAGGLRGTGVVRLRGQGEVRQRRLSDGRVVFTLRPYRSTGRKSVEVVYPGNKQLTAGRKRVTFRVVRR